MVFCTETDLQNNEQNDIGDAQIFDLINYDITDTIFIDDETTYYIRFDVKAGFYQVVNHIITNHKIKDLQSENWRPVYSWFFDRTFQPTGIF